MSTLPQMPCAEFVERVTSYLEGALDHDDRARLEEHLEVCPHCVVYLDQLRTTLELTGQLREDDVTPQMRGDLLEVFSQWRRSAGS